MDSVRRYVGAIAVMPGIGITGKLSAGGAAEVEDVAQGLGASWSSEHSENMLQNIFESGWSVYGQDLHAL